MALIIGVTGMAGSGKSTAVSYLKERGFSIIYIGELTKEELQKRNLLLNEENEKQIRNQLRKEMGLGVYAQLSIPKISQSIREHQKVALDGIYSWEEVKILRQEYGDIFRLLAILSAPKIRYERLLNRKTRPLTFDQAFKRDQDEIENLNKGGTIAMADYNLVNEGTLKEFYHNLERIWE